MTGTSGEVTIQPKRLYTQQEVDALVEQKTNQVSQSAEIKQESIAADKQVRLENEEVAKLVTKSNRILVSISSHAFPIDIFPNSITVEEGRITIIKRHLLSSEVHSIDLKDISNVFINSTIFFSQLVIISKTFEENEIKLRNLRSKEAVFVRRIIEGLRVFANKHIDTSTYSVEELVSKLEELSTTEIVT